MVVRKQDGIWSHGCISDEVGAGTGASLIRVKCLNIVRRVSQTAKKYKSSSIYLIIKQDTTISEQSRQYQFPNAVVNQKNSVQVPLKEESLHGELIGI
jgi:hypothetical protein